MNLAAAIQRWQTAAIVPQPIGAVTEIAGTIIEVAMTGVALEEHVGRAFVAVTEGSRASLPRYIGQGLLRTPFERCTNGFVPTGAFELCSYGVRGSPPADTLLPQPIGAVTEVAGTIIEGSRTSLPGCIGQGPLRTPFEQRSNGFVSTGVFELCSNGVRRGPPVDTLEDAITGVGAAPIIEVSMAGGALEATR